MPCGCFGGGSAGGVGKQDPGDKYIPKPQPTLQGHDDTKPQPITTKPPVSLINPIPASPEKLAIQSAAVPVTAQAPGGPTPCVTVASTQPTTDVTGPQGTTGVSGREDDPDKANRRRDVVASYYSDECELLAYKTTGSRPTSQVGSNTDDGEASPPQATSSPAPSSPASARSAASTRADLVEKRREFFKPLIGDVQEPSWTGTGSRSLALQQQPPGVGTHIVVGPPGHHLPGHPHAQSLLEAHDRELVNYKEPTVKDVVHKFEHLPEQMTSTPKPRETEVRLGRNSSTTVTVLHNTEKHQTQKPIHMVQHKDAGELTPDQQKQEQQLVNKAAVHQQLLAGGQTNLRPTPKPREIPDNPPPVTITAPDQPHDDNCIIQTTVSAYNAVDAAPAPAPAKPPHLPPPTEHAAQGLTQSQPVITEPRNVVAEPKPIVSDHQPIVSDHQHIVSDHQPIVSETDPVAKPEPIVAETKPVVAETKPIVAETKPVVAETKPVVAETKPVVAEPKPVVTEPKPVVTETKPVVEPEYVIAEPKPVVAEPKPVVVEPKPVVAEPKPVVAEPVLESAHVSGTVSDFTHSKLFTEYKSDTCEITQIQDSKTIEPVSVTKEVSFVTQESELISVLKENEKNIFSSQSEQMPFDSHPEITTKIINSEPSYIIESKSIITKNQDIVSHKENSMHGTQQVSFDLGEATNKECNKSVISKAEPAAEDTMPLELLADISQSKHLVEVNSTSDGGTMHTETTKSMVTDGDSNMFMDTKTVTTTIISSSEPFSEITSTQALMTEPLYDRTLACISESSSLVVDGSSEPSFLMTDGSPIHHVRKSNADLIHDDQHQQPDIQSTLHSSMPPMTQIGSSPSPSSSPSPRNSSHSSPASPCASSPSPPASPRTHKLSMVELQHKQDTLAPQVKQEAQDSCPTLSQDRPSPEDHAHYNTALNNQDAPKVQDLKDDILVSGPPSSPMDSRNPHTCNEADVTAPASLEDDGLGSEIDDALDSMDCLSEEGNSHSHQHHHQSVPAPPPPPSSTS